MSPLDLTKRRDELLAQCPGAAVVAPEQAATLPIHVTEWGAEGPHVLLVHGGVQGRLGGGPGSFDKQKALASLGWRLLLVDRPGFGRSPSRGVDDMEADSHWIADKLGDGAHLIGHSWGGAEALLAAARRPLAVRSLVLIEPALQSLGMFSARLRDDSAAQASASEFMGIMMSAQSPADYALRFGRYLSGASGAGTLEAPSNPALTVLESDPEQAVKMGCALLQAKMASPETMKQAATAVAEAGVPVLVVSGGWSPFLDAICEVVAQLAGGRHVVVASSDHFVQAASGEAFNAQVDAFMREADRNRPRERPPIKA